jgi:hypothetical protein
MSGGIERAMEFPVKPKVYVETSIFSALVGRPTRNVELAGRQQSTRNWWQTDADSFLLFASEIVQLEAREGDREMAKRRLEYISTIPRLSNTGESEWIAETILNAGILPTKAKTDALHVGIATAHSLNYVVSWNLRHLANAPIYQRVSRHLVALGYNPPVICTPIQLPGVSHG